MIVTYHCKCGHWFNGHLHEAIKRLSKEFPLLYNEITSNIIFEIAMTCPKCGNMDHKKNMDSDEDFNPSLSKGDNNGTQN